MSVISEIRTLQVRSVAIAAVRDVNKRHHAGMRLELECRAFEDKHKIIGGLDAQIEVEFRAVLTILFDHVLFDTFEDHDFEAVTSGPKADLDKVVRGINES